MQLHRGSHWAEARASVENPRAGARRILNMNLPLGIAAQALLVVALLTALLSTLVMMLGPADGPIAAMSPLDWAAVQAVGMFVGAGAVHVVGRWFGGQGTLPGALAVMAWAQFIIWGVQVVQVIALIVLPPLAMPLALVALALTFWLLVNFIAELHGFSSLIKVLLGMIGTGFALIVVASGVIAAFLGTAGV